MSPGSWNRHKTRPRNPGYDAVMTQSILIQGATLLLPDAQEQTDLLIADGQIAQIGGTARADITIDARGLTLAPALIDVHGDAFERQVMPRPGVFFPLDAALLETDRQLAANGIATAYHAITLSWAPGLRSVARGREMIEALTRLAPRFCVENRVQLRWETFAFEAEDLIRTALTAPLTPSLAFNDHTSMGLRDRSLSIQERAFEHAPDFKVADLNDPGLARFFAKDAERAGLTPDEYLVRIKETWTRRAEVPDHIAGMAAAARAAGAPMLSHDDTQAQTREFYRAHGCRVSEFPMTMEAAEAARAAGDPIIFGSPNALRGGSHIGSLGAADMVEAGMCDALASDYYYPAMLGAVARLEAERRASRPALWALVSDGPARAMNLTDRGRIEAGKRADLVLVDWPDGQPPVIRATYVAGQPVYRAQPLRRG